MPRRGESPKYQPLADYLAAQPAAVTSLTLTVAEIEVIIGAPLLVSARARQWWTNLWSESQSRAWREAGWRVTGRAFRATPPTITFGRLPPR